MEFFSGKWLPWVGKKAFLDRYLLFLSLTFFILLELFVRRCIHTSSSVVIKVVFHTLRLPIQSSVNF